jgi:hypothetical protein
MYDIFNEFKNNIFVPRMQPHFLIASCFVFIIRRNGSEIMPLWNAKQRVFDRNGMEKGTCAAADFCGGIHG